MWLQSSPVQNKHMILTCLLQNNHLGIWVWLYFSRRIAICTHAACAACMQNAPAWDATNCAAALLSLRRDSSPSWTAPFSIFTAGPCPLSHKSWSVWHWGQSTNAACRHFLHHQQCLSPCAACNVVYAVNDRNKVQLRSMHAQPLRTTGSSPAAWYACTASKNA